MMCDKLNHPDFHLIFPIPSSAKKDENICDFYTSNWKEYVLDSELNVTLTDGKMYLIVETSSLELVLIVFQA